mmetsp:Transcript_33929/g.80848  ORF Transcript_33929/g.80848 Transcript_33929/m.80848 type:complete len:318 (+) Transcript_33929:34-987(+)
MHRCTGGAWHERRGEKPERSTGTRGRGARRGNQVEALMRKVHLRPSSASTTSVATVSATMPSGSKRTTSSCGVPRRGRTPPRERAGREGESGWARVKGAGESGVKRARKGSETMESGCSRIETSPLPRTQNSPSTAPARHSSLSSPANTSDELRPAITRESLPSSPLAAASEVSHDFSTARCVCCLPQFSYCCRCTLFPSAPAVSTSLPVASPPVRCIAGRRIGFIPLRSETWTAEAGAESSKTSRVSNCSSATLPSPTTPICASPPSNPSESTNPRYDVSGITAPLPLSAKARLALCAMARASSWGDTVYCEKSLR